MRRIFILLCIALSAFSGLLQAQKVGLVLSGGGAPGIAHIGIIKALEENNIPIDYITGTSMGAIVGGLYAMGYTADQMIELFKSSDFRRWTTGEAESRNLYYYRNSDPKPSVIDLRFNINKLNFIEFNPNLFPTNLVSPNEMNYAFVPLCAQANALCGGNFNKLFVPFRCVASDIYKKEVVIFRRGDLGDAIRSSMTFPFVYKPIMVDNNLLFDGGLLNNFPIDVMQDDFNPDFIIGSVVANNPSKPDKQDVVKQLQNMIINHTDYTVPPADGILLKFDLKNVNMFDFSRIDELVQLGYDSTLKHLDEIKARLHRRVPANKLAERRKTFVDRLPVLNFQHISVVGVDSLQKLYVERVFHSGDEVFDLKEFKDSYYKLISDDKISEVIPHALYNPVNGSFDLNLDVDTQDQLKVLLGGNISSSTSNQAYIGLTYQNLSEYSQTAYVDAQFGRMYNGLGLGTRLEIPTQKNWYMKLAVVMHKFDYFEGNRLFYADNRAANFTQNEVYSKLSIGLPLTMRGRLEFGVGYGALIDYYSQDSAFVSSAKVSDNSIFSLGSAFLRLESSALNNVMYPTAGFKYSNSFQLIGGEENFKSARYPAQNVSQRMDLWFQYRSKLEHYFPFTSRFTLGAYGEAAFSTRKLLQNYTSSVIQAPLFQPTPHSRTVFNDAFSANQFVAIGVKPIFNFTKELHLRGEAYWFVPYKQIAHLPDNSAAYSAPFTSSQFMAETTLVFNFKIASAGIYANYYSSAASQWNFGVNIGILLFNPKFTE